MPLYHGATATSPPMHKSHRVRRRGLELETQASIHSAVFARTPTSREGR